MILRRLFNNSLRRTEYHSSSALSSLGCERFPLRLQPEQVGGGPVVACGVEETKKMAILPSETAVSSFADPCQSRRSPYVARALEQALPC